MRRHKYEGGGDRAYWDDDGWWPTFFAIKRERHGLVPWKRERLVATDARVRE